MLTFRVLALRRHFSIRSRSRRFACSPFIVIFRLDNEADFSSVGPSSEGIEELWVVLAHKGNGGATLLVGTC